MSTAPAKHGSNKATIIQVWHLLPRIRRLSFTARANPDSQTGWNGHGVADVTTAVDNHVVRFSEKGHFTPEGSAHALAFNNVYRWQYQGTGMALWHERFGAAAAVFLFRLVADGPSRLASEAGHLCGQDIYTATLSMEPDGFTLDWHINGPRKSERLTYWYTALTS